MSKLNIVVLSGGASAEHDISLITGKVVLSNLDKSKYNARSIVISREGKWLMPASERQISGETLSKDMISVETGDAVDRLKKDEKIDAVFIAMHGTFGEDGTIQGLLELAGVPYTGSGVLASALAMDKLRASELCAYHGLKIPKYVSFTAAEWNKKSKGVIELINYQLGFPCVFKPTQCGSSVGITIAKSLQDLPHSAEEALKHFPTVIVQEFIKGTEVTCAILDEGGDSEPIALPPTEIVPITSEFFDLQAKYTKGATEEITPARLPEKTLSEIQSIALNAHKILGCYGLSRTDQIVADHGIFYIETNTIPGMTETSLYPQAAKAVGLSFPELLDKLIASALRKKK